MKLVYICSPLRGNIEKNMKKAIAYCACAARQGVIPIAPHTTFTLYLQDNIDAQRQQGLNMGLELLKRCDELWVCGDTVSQGMKGEIAQAKEQSIATRYLSDREIIDIELKNVEEEYGKMFFTRTDGQVSSVMFPDRAEDELSQEEVGFIQDYITDHMGSSQEQTQMQEEDFDMAMSQ